MNGFKDTTKIQQGHSHGPRGMGGSAKAAFKPGSLASLTKSKPEGKKP